MVDRFHDHVDGGKEKRARCSLPSPEKALPNDLIVAADGDIDAENGPCNEMVLKRGVRCHVKTLFALFQRGNVAVMNRLNDIALKSAARPDPEEPYTPLK